MTVQHLSFAWANAILPYCEEPFPLLPTSKDMATSLNRFTFMFLQLFVKRRVPHQNHRRDPTNQLRHSVKQDEAIRFAGVTHVTDRIPSSDGSALSQVLHLVSHARLVSRIRPNTLTISFDEVWLFQNSHCLSSSLQSPLHHTVLSNRFTIVSDITGRMD